MKIKELRIKKTDKKSLLEFIRDKRVELRKARFLSPNSDVKNVHSKKELKRDIAKAYTIINESKKQKHGEEE